MARLSALGVDFDHWCFACGQLNDGGLHLDFDVLRGRAETRWTPERGHQHYDDRLGYLPSGDLGVNGAVLRASDAAILAKAGAAFLLMPDARRRELERRYSQTDETFARVRAPVAAEERVREHERT